MSVSSEVKRTLVKSPPELWSELSDAESLARHLGDLDGVRITRAEPESAVEWEADGARGSVQLEPSGFGTKVILSLTRELAELEMAAAVVEEEEEEKEKKEPLEPAPAEEAPNQRGRFFARLFRRRSKERLASFEPVEPKAEPAPDPESVPVVVFPPEPEPVVAVEPETRPEPDPEAPIADVAGDLAAVEAQMAEQDAELLRTLLDRLGAAHHRPFSRG